MATAKPPASRPAVERTGVLSCLRERMIAFAASRLSRDLAEDLAQEVLLVLHEKYPHLDRLEDLLPLSLQVLRYKMMAYRRKMQRHGEYSQLSVEDLPLADSRPDPELDAERREMAARLAKSLTLLGDRCRELFRLKLEGKSFEEIRAALGAASINTVYTWDFRCRQHLLELMGGRWEKEP